MKEITLAESKQFAALEAVIRLGKKTFVEVGNALAEIRDRKWYQNDFVSIRNPEILRVAAGVQAGHVNVENRNKPVSHKHFLVVSDAWPFAIVNTVLRCGEWGIQFLTVRISVLPSQFLSERRAVEIERQVMCNADRAKVCRSGDQFIIRESDGPLFPCYPRCGGHFPLLHPSAPDGTIHGIRHTLPAGGRPETPGIRRRDRSWHSGPCLPDSSTQITKGTRHEKRTNRSFAGY